jgi:hypothetical protein
MYSTCLRWRRILVFDRLTAPEAANLLGVTSDAIYKRVQRDQIPWDKDEEGRVYVYVDASKPVEAEASDIASESTGSVQDSSKDVLLDVLRDQNELLHTELAAWQEEARHKNHIIMTMAQRIPELQTLPESHDADDAAREPALKGDMSSQDQEFPEQRSWLFRFFLGTLVG